MNDLWWEDDPNTDLEPIDCLKEIDRQPAAWVSYTIHYTTSMAPSQLKGITYDDRRTHENTAKAPPDYLLEYAPQGTDFL